MASFLPQVIKIWREKDASQVSLNMYVVTVTGFTLWTVYGVLLKSWPLVGSTRYGVMMMTSSVSSRW